MKSLSIFVRSAATRTFLKKGATLLDLATGKIVTRTNNSTAGALGACKQLEFDWLELIKYKAHPWRYTTGTGLR